VQQLGDVWIDGGHQDGDAGVGQLHVQNEDLDPRRVGIFSSLRK
jgi:hypothetical protein